MDMKASWFAKLQATYAEVRLLVTIGLGRRAEIKIHGHPGTWGRVLRAGSHQVVDVSSESGMTYPYWPTLVNWPRMAYLYEPESREVRETVTTVELLSLAGYVEKFFKKDHPQNAWMQIDLWLPGLTLEDSLTIFAGPITEVSFESEKGIVSLSSTDRFDGIELEFPFSDDTLNNDEFSELAEDLIGRARRVFVLNELRDFLPVVPISHDLRSYYVCEPTLEVMPSEVQIGTETVKQGSYKFVRGHMDTSGQEYTRLVFRDRIENLGYSGTVLVRGGRGPSTQNPLQFFIDRQPGLRLTERATSYIADINRRGIFDYFTIINNKAKILDIIHDKLLPQSNLIGFYRGGRLDIIQQSGVTRIHNLALHGNLKYRLPLLNPETDGGKIFNAIDVQYRRNYQPVTGKFSRYAKLVDKAAGGALGRFLTMSEALYGRLFFRLEAPDLGEERDAERLGQSILEQTAFAHRQARYHMDYRYGLFLDINDRARITDPEVMWDATPCRVVQMVFLPTGLEVTFQTEDGLNAF